MTAAFGFALVLLTVSAAVNVMLLMGYRQQAGQLRRLKRDQRIGELEQDLRVSLPALASDPSPLARVLGALVGIWLASSIRNRTR